MCSKCTLTRTNLPKRRCDDPGTRQARMSIGTVRQIPAACTFKSKETNIFPKQRGRVLICLPSTFTLFVCITLSRGRNGQRDANHSRAPSLSKQRSPFARNVFSLQVGTQVVTEIVLKRTRVGSKSKVLSKDACMSSLRRWL